MPTLASSRSRKTLTENTTPQDITSLLDMRNVATVILGGGQGARLFPLTTSRCKPALCYGGRYRLIDIPVSNAYNSGCRKIFIITQFLSTSLHRHIFSTYSPGTFSTGIIELLSSEERPESKIWFQGTADAVRQNINYISENPAEYILILSGDQLYSMDFNAMLLSAKKSGADVTIAALPVDEAHAKRMGIMKINESQFITDFQEKPEKKEDLGKFRLPTGGGGTSGPGFLASMGIYLFRRQALIDLLKRDPREDFGKHLIPTKVAEGNIAAYVHQGYWEDIGTIGSFHKANIALTEKLPPFNCYNEEWPIFAKPATLPAARLTASSIENSFVCEGSVIEANEITGSLFGPRTIIRQGSIIRNSYVMGNDSYSQGGTISKNCVIENAIIDKNVTIGDNVQLTNRKHLKEHDGEGVFIRDGIIVVPRGAVIPDNFTL